MKIRRKHVSLAGKIVVDLLLLALLWAVLALPASSFSLLKFEPKNEVSSEQHTRYYIEPLESEKDNTDHRVFTK